MVQTVRGIAVKSDKISLPTRDAGFIDDLLDRWATAGVLGISVRTLDRWHRLGFGPPRIRYAGQIRYRLSSLARWVLSHETVPQSPVVPEASQDSKRFSQTPAGVPTPANDPPSGSASGVDGAPSDCGTNEGDHVQY
jgi:hypothetical protein